MSFVERIGLAIVGPRRALDLGGDRRNTGRAGSDLLAAIAIMIVATELRWIVQAVWLGAVVDVSLGVKALVHVLTGTLTIDLGVLVVAAAAIAIAGRRTRDLGRAFDLACVAVLPLVLVDLVAGVAAAIAQAAPPDPVRWLVMAIAYGWTGLLVGLAVVAIRRDGAADRDRSTRARAGWIVVAIAAAGVAAQTVWLAHHTDLVRPLRAGGPAPALSLPRIGPGGALGARVTLAPGTITVVDFWATWCGPCLRAMPQLDQLARRHPEIHVLTVNLDDPAEARAIFDREHYGLTLLADDGDASERWGVTSIPHTVLIAADGMLAAHHANVAELEAEVARLGH